MMLPFLGGMVSVVAGSIYKMPAALIHKYTYKVGADPKHIVIVGGSFSGHAVAKALSTIIPSGYTMTLIEKGPEHPDYFALPRYSVVGGYEDTAFIPLKEQRNGFLEGSYNVIWDECVGLTKDYVELKSGDKVPYAYLVIATGRAKSPPANLKHLGKADGIEELKGYQQTIKNAKNIAVVGSGAVGIQLSTDIKDVYKDEKNVDLYCSRDHVLPRFEPSVAAKAEPIIESLGVNLIRNSRPTVEGNTVILPDGTKKTYDAVFFCAGELQKRSPFADYLGDLVKSNGHLIVDENLKVKDNIYAVGDIHELGPKMARASFYQGPLVAENIVAQINGQPLQKYVEDRFEGALHMTLGICRDLLYLEGKEPIVLEHEPMEDKESYNVWKKFDVPVPEKK